MQSTGCCAPFDVKRWDEKTHKWKQKLFLQDEVIQLFHFPVNMGQVVKRMFAKITAAKAAPPDADFLMLCYDPSPWKSQIHMTVTKDIPEGKMVRLSGTFVSKVFDGPYNLVPQWIKTMDAYLATHDQKASKYYFHFAYCPKCAKTYGHNYCVAFAQVD